MIVATLGYVMYVIIAGNVDADVDVDVNDTESLTLKSGIVHLNAVVRTLTHSRNLAKLTNVDDYARIPERQYDVPPKIHFIWLGSFLPEKYKENILTYKTYNTDYEINLWTDCQRLISLGDLNGIRIRDVNSLTMTNRDLFDSETNYGFKSDILRYEVVHAEGGIYTDTDSLAVKSFDRNFERSFVAYIHREDASYIPNGCFGFRRLSNFMRYVITTLRRNFDRRGNRRYRTGPPFFTACFLRYNDSTFNVINERFLIFRSNDSYTFHTMDATWISRAESMDNATRVILAILVVCAWSFLTIGCLEILRCARLRKRKREESKPKSGCHSSNFRYSYLRKFHFDGAHLFVVADENITLVHASVETTKQES